MASSGRRPLGGTTRRKSRRHLRKAVFQQLRIGHQHTMPTYLSDPELLDRWLKLLHDQVHHPDGLATLLRRNR